MGKRPRTITICLFSMVLAVDFVLGLFDMGVGGLCFIAIVSLWMDLKDTTVITFFSLLMTLPQLVRYSGIPTFAEALGLSIILIVPLVLFIRTLFERIFHLRNRVGKTVTMQRH